VAVWYCGKFNLIWHLIFSVIKKHELIIYSPFSLAYAGFSQHDHLAFSWDIFLIGTTAVLQSVSLPQADLAPVLASPTSAAYFAHYPIKMKILYPGLDPYILMYSNRYSKIGSLYVIYFYFISILQLN
jgi:hypothetical protein